MVKRASGGYTLIEAMITVAIIGVIASLGGALMTQLNRNFILARTRADLQREARAAIYLMTRELRQAQSASIVIDRSTAAQPYYSRITFTKEQGTTMTFVQAGNLLQMQWGGHTETLTNNLRFLAFTFPRTDDMTILSVSVTLQEASFGGQTKALHMASQQVQIMN